MVLFRGSSVREEPVIIFNKYNLFVLKSAVLLLLVLLLMLYLAGFYGPESFIIFIAFYK